MFLVKAYFLQCKKILVATSCLHVVTQSQKHSEEIIYIIAVVLNINNQKLRTIINLPTDIKAFSFRRPFNFENVHLSVKVVSYTRRFRSKYGQHRTLSGFEADSEFKYAYCSVALRIKMTYSRFSCRLCIKKY